MSISVRGDAEGFHQSVRVLQRLTAGGESRHRKAEDVFPRQPETIHRLRGDDEGMRRIQAAGNPDDHPLEAAALQAFHQAVHLNVVRFEAAFVALLAITRDEWEAFDRSGQRYLEHAGFENRKGCDERRECGHGDPPRHR